MSKALTFSNHLYLGEGIKCEKLDKLKKDLINAPLFTKVFLITISTSPVDQLDILESKYITYPYYNTHALHVVGLADSNKEAIDLIQTIVQDCLDQQGNVDLKSFLLKE